MDKISVILPVYNVEEFICQCLDSIINQSYSNLEIILVDDGSPDNSGKICDEYAKKDNRIQVIHKTNAGAPAARNDALAVATGEWIAYVDPDDWIELNEFEEVMNVAEKENSDIILFNVFEQTDDIQTVRESFSSDFTTEDKKIINELQLAALDKHFAPFNQNSIQYFPWDKIYKRSLLEEHNVLWPINLKANDDIIYIIQAFQFAQKVSYINKPFYHWRRNPDSISHKYTPDRVQIDQDVYKEMIKLRDEFGLGEEFNMAFYSRIIKNSWLCCGRCFFNPNNPKSFSEKLRDISEMLNYDIVSTAFLYVDRSKEDKVERLLALFKHPQPIWFYIVYKAYEFKHAVFH